MTRYKNTFNKSFNESYVKITVLRSIPKKIITVYKAVYFRLCIELMHITPLVTAEEYDGSHPSLEVCRMDVTGGVISIRSIHDRKYTALHTPI